MLDLALLILEVWVHWFIIYWLNEELFLQNQIICNKGRFQKKNLEYSKFGQTHPSTLVNGKKSGKKYRTSVMQQLQNKLMGKL